MAIRTPVRKYDREEMVAYIHGIDPEGDVANILVHKRGKDVRFSGRLGAHNVSASNAADLAEWVHEAATLWTLEDAIGIPRGWSHTPEMMAKMELLNINAAKRKEMLAASERP
jgi:hypothetical protein